jgi:hypothetical protein
LWLLFNIHFHMLFLDGVYVADRRGRPRLRCVPAPTSGELTALLERIVQRVGRHLERRGLLERDEEQAWLSEDGGEASPLDGLLGASITYRIAVGPQRGEKAFTLRTLPPADEDSFESDKLARVSGFSRIGARDVRNRVYSEDTLRTARIATDGSPPRPRPADRPDKVGRFTHDAKSLAGWILVVYSRSSER